MSIDEQKILIAKYLGLITETDGLWYLDNTHELKYDEDWNWIISAYKQIKNIEFEKIGTTDRIGDILRGIFNTDIHPTAVIDPTAIICDGVRIGAGCYIGPKVVLEDNTTLYPNVTILDECTVGKNTVIWPGAVIRERCHVEIGRAHV